MSAGYHDMGLFLSRRTGLENVSGHAGPLRSGGRNILEWGVRRRHRMRADGRLAIAINYFRVL